MLRVAGSLLCAALFAALALAPAARAQDDPLVGYWAVENDVSGERYIIKIEQVAPGSFVGAVSEKDDATTMCWDVGELAIRVSGGDGSYRGTAQLYDEQCEARMGVADLSIELSADRTSAKVTYAPPSGGCRDCEPETWSRAAPPPAPLWLILPVVLLGTVVIVTVVVLVIALRPKARARRRERRQAQLTGNVTLRPVAGAVSDPAVRVPENQGIAIRLEPRLVPGQPVIREAR